MILGAVLLVYLIGGAVDGVDGVHAYAALEAGAGGLAQQALHLDLFDEVVGGLVDVGEAVDLFPGEVGGGGHQVLVVGGLGQVVGHLYGGDGGAEDGVIHGVLHLFAKHIHAQVQGPQALDIFITGHQCHSRYFLSFLLGDFFRLHCQTLVYLVVSEGRRIGRSAPIYKQFACQLELFFCFFRKKRKNTKKEEKNLPEHPPRPADVPGDFSKNGKRGKKISG